MTTTTIYGVGDDGIRVEGSTSGWGYRRSSCFASTIRLTAPDGARVELEVDQWEADETVCPIRLAAASPFDMAPWPIRFLPTPGPAGGAGIALEITHPTGVLIECDGEPVLPDGPPTGSAA